MVLHERRGARRSGLFPRAYPSQRGGRVSSRRGAPVIPRELDGIALTPVIFCDDTEQHQSETERHEGRVRPAGLSREGIAKHFDALAPSWDRKHVSGGLRRFTRPLRTAYLRGICDGLERPRVLDVGCGTGQQLIALADRIGEGVGIDISSAMVDRARANARLRDVGDRLRFEVLAAEDAHVEPLGGFDLVMCVSSLEHMADPGAVLIRMAELLRPDGLVVLYMASRWHPRSLYDRLARRAGVIPPYRYFAARSLTRRMQAVGLRPFDVGGAVRGRWQRTVRRLSQRLVGWIVAPVLGSYFSVFTAEARHPARVSAPSPSTG